MPDKKKWTCHICVIFCLYFFLRGCMFFFLFHRRYGGDAHTRACVPRVHNNHTCHMRARVPVYIFCRVRSTTWLCSYVFVFVCVVCCMFLPSTHTHTHTYTGFFVLFVANRQPRNCYCNEATMNKKLVVVFTHSNEQEMCVTVCICVHLIFFPSTNCNTFSCNLHICRNQEITCTDILLILLSVEISIQYIPFF